ncbi:MAG: regulator, partial [FCB group bacterium]
MNNSSTKLLVILIILFCGISSKLVAQWEECNNGPYGDINIIVTDGNRIFAGTNGGGIYLSTNNGGSWKAKNNGLPNMYISALAISGSNIFAGAYSDNNFSNGGIFLSTDNGENWKSITRGLIDTNISSIAIFGNYILAGT